MKWTQAICWVVMLVIIASVGNYCFGMSDFESVAYALLASIAYDVHCLKDKT